MRRWKIKSEKKSEKKNSLRFQFRSPRKEKSFSGEKDFSSIPSRETFQILHFETFSKIWRQNLWKIFFKKIFFLEEIFLKLFHLQFWKKFQNVKFEMFFCWGWTRKNFVQTGKEKSSKMKERKVYILKLFFSAEEKFTF